MNTLRQILGDALIITGGSIVLILCCGWAIDMTYQRVISFREIYRATIWHRDREKHAARMRRIAELSQAWCVEPCDATDAEKACTEIYAIAQRYNDPPTV